MQSSYDADDFMRRGFFGSLIGFRKRSSSKNEPAPPPPPPAPRYVAPSHVAHPQPIAHQPIREHIHHHVVPPPHQLGLPTNRTEYDIYREIVSEAEYIERSSPTTPDFSCPTTPQPSYSHQYHGAILAPIPPIPSQLPPPPPPPPQPQPQPPQQQQQQQQPAPFDPSLMMPNPPEMMHAHQYHMVMSPIAPHPIPVDTNGVPLRAQCPMAPPPYSSFAPQSSSPMQQLPQMANLPFDVKREVQEQLVLKNGQQQLSIEEIVKLVVVALKDSQIEEEGREEESPEEILRRKRIQNNLAAARYRKRQREARECAEQELGNLTKRNDELREQVQRMEREIRALKQAVLGPR